MGTLRSSAFSRARDKEGKRKRKEGEGKYTTQSFLHNRYRLIILPCMQDKICMLKVITAIVAS